MRLSVVSGVVALVAILVGGIASASLEGGIAERIKAVGSVCVKGDACAANLQVASSGPKSGEQVYKTNCLACHASGAGGAPKFRVAADWSSRMASGLDSLYSNSINGLNRMPARGLCGSCSDDEIKAAVDYMVEGL